jgi:hypothetical protein
MSRSFSPAVIPLAVASCVAAWALSLGAAAQTMPAPDPQAPTAPTTMQTPDSQPTTSMQAPDPAKGPLTATPGATQSDGSAAAPNTISSPPIPDSAENRKRYGGPDSAGGRATAPHPGPVTMKGHKAHAAAAVDPAPKP